MKITCGFCKYQGEAEEFVPRDQKCGPDWICPKCLLGTYVPTTLTVEDLISIEAMDEAV